MNNSINPKDILYSFGYPLSILLILLVTISFNQATDSYAQNNETNQNQSNPIEQRLNLTSTGPEHPIEEERTNVSSSELNELSKNGNYMVSLRYNNLSPDGFDVEVFFQDPRIQQGTNETVEQKWTNISGQSPNDRGLYVDPSIIQYAKPATGYDMTIYDDSGKVLWQKANQPVHSSGGFERIVFEQEYSGPISVEINNIKQDSKLDLETTNMTDSVSFSLNIPPQ